MSSQANPIHGRASDLSRETGARAAAHWDLWLLRALQPAAGPSDLEVLLQARQAWRKRLQELPGRLLAGAPELTGPGRKLLAADPALRRGVLLTLRLGPYPCVLEPLLAAGLTVTVVADERCAARWKPLADEFARSRRFRGSLRWLHGPMTRDALSRKLEQAVRDGGPVVVFVDGEGLESVPSGAAGLSVTCRLPGREILVSTSLSRWLCRRAVPVHPVAVRWREGAGGVVWRRQATQRWSPRDDPRSVARLIHTWAFHEIMADPAQWSGWSMLAAAALAAAGGGWSRGHVPGDAVPPGLREDYRRAFVLCLERAAATVRVALEAELAVWPGEILADATHGRFYPACGLRDRDLEVLRTGSPTLADLERRFGREWVVTHLQRLCLLGVARLRAASA